MDQRRFKPLGSVGTLRMETSYRPAFSQPHPVRVSRLTSGRTDRSFADFAFSTATPIA